jgi:hypothetical protein
MLKKYPMLETVEIAFWNTTIPALTVARLLRGWLSRGRLLLSDRLPHPVFIQSLVWSAIGLTLGLLVGIVCAGL